MPSRKFSKYVLILSVQGPWYDPKHAKCAEISDDFQHQLNAKVKAIVEPLGYRWVASPDKPGDFEDHLGRKTPHVKNRGADCTHYCTPSDYLERLTDAILDAL